MILRSRPFAHAQVARRYTTALTLGTLALAALTGCSSPGSTKASNDASSPASASPSPSVDPQAALKAQVLQAYHGYWDTVVQAWTQGSLDGVQVEKYARGSADGMIRSGLAYYQSQNLVLRGRPALSPSVSQLEATKQPYNATVTDCVDDSNFIPVNKDTGKPAALASSVHRHPATYKAQFEGHWWIVSGQIDRTRAC